MTPSSLRILCLGASITAGFHRFGLLHHPYARQLEKRLQQELLSTKIHIDVDAVSGDRVLGGSYVPRLKARLRPEQRTYDFIIIQGGGNDLGYGSSPEQISEGLKEIWNVALQSGANVLALTVTETADRRENVRARYTALNGLIAGYRAERFGVAEVCCALPWPKLEEDQRALWDDGLHLTRRGYDMLGDAVADAVLEVLDTTAMTKL